MVLNEPIQ